MLKRHWCWFGRDLLQVGKMNQRNAQRRHTTVWITHVLTEPRVSTVIGRTPVSVHLDTPVTSSFSSSLSIRPLDDSRSGFIFYHCPCLPTAVNSPRQSTGGPSQIYRRLGPRRRTKKSRRHFTYTSPNFYRGQKVRKVHVYLLPHGSSSSLSPRFKWSTSRKCWRHSFCCKALQSKKFTSMRSELVDDKFFASMNSRGNTGNTWTVNCPF